MAVARTEINERILRRNEEKWSASLMDAGWTVLPSIILEKQQAIGLDPIDVNILMQLARHWWFNDNLPHPSKKPLRSAWALTRVPSGVASLRWRKTA